MSQISLVLDRVIQAEVEVERSHCFRRRLAVDMLKDRMRFFDRETVCTTVESYASDEGWEAAGAFLRWALYIFHFRSPISIKIYVKDFVHSYDFCCACRPFTTSNNQIALATVLSASAVVLFQLPCNF